MLRGKSSLDRCFVLRLIDWHGRREKTIHLITVHGWHFIQVEVELELYIYIFKQAINRSTSLAKHHVFVFVSNSFIKGIDKNGFCEAAVAFDLPNLINSSFSSSESLFQI